MKNLIQILFLLLAVTLTSFSCEDEDNLMVSDETVAEYLVFGHFYGHCAGDNCIQIFKITNGKLYEDTLDDYPTHDRPYVGNYTELSQANYEKLSALRGSIPSQLYAETDTIIGQPDAGDWGGLYLEVFINGQKKFWLIDQNKTNLPVYLHDFVDEMNATIADIN